MSDVAGNAVLRAEYPALPEALWKAAPQQLRNMASLGGNLLQRTRRNYFRHSARPTRATSAPPARAARRKRG